MTSTAIDCVPSIPGPAPAPETILETRVVTGSGGGPEKTILNGPAYLAPQGYRTVCAYLHPPADLDFAVLQRRADAQQVELISIPDRGPFDVSVTRRLARICRDENVAVWHGHDYKSNFLGLLVRRKWPMHLVSTVHGWVDRHWKSPLFDAVDRWSLKRYEQVICVSEDLLETCRRSGMSQDRLHLIENGIDVERFQRRQSAAAARQALGWPPDGLVLGAIGRLSDEKGFDLLIEAVRRLLPVFPDLRLVIAGNGPRNAKLQDQIERSGLTQSVRLLGFCDDVLTLLEALDVFVLSSRREGLPNVVLEAMAAEVPVFATRIAGVPKVITDEVDGMLVEPENLESLIAGLQRLLADAALRQRLAQAGRETVVRSRSFRVRMDRVREIYDALLSPPDGSIHVD